MFVVFSRWKPTKGTRLLICAQAARYQRFIWMISLTPMRISKNFTEKTQRGSSIPFEVRIDRVEYIDISDIKCFSSL